MFNLNYLYREFDPEYIQRLQPGRKEKYRKRLIALFLLKSYYGNPKNIKEQKDKHIVKNTKDYLKFCIFWTFPFSMILYQLMFRSVYELRSFYFNPRSLSVGIKFPIAYAISSAFFIRYWYNYIYMPEIYEMATIKYSS
jgi:hypothetical protein